MAAAKKQAKRQRTAPRTPMKPKEPNKPMIGSSSTWRQDELDRFEVRMGSEVDAKKIVPEKWFDFSSLEEYNTGRRLVIVTDFSASSIDRYRNEGCWERTSSTREGNIF